MTVSITKELLIDLREDLKEVLKPLAEKYGIEIHSGKGIYGRLEGSLKLELRTTDANGDSQEALNFKSNAWHFDLNPDWLYKTFQDNYGNTFEIVGWNNKARKNCILLKRLNDNRECMCSPEMLKSAMLLQEAKDKRYEEIRKEQA